MDKVLGIGWILTQLISLFTIRKTVPCGKPSSFNDYFDKEIDDTYSKEDYSYDGFGEKSDGVYSKEDFDFSSYDDYGKKTGTEGNGEKVSSSEFSSSDGTSHWPQLSFACLSLFFVTVLVV